jgi:hypothetical protein
VLLSTVFWLAISVAGQSSAHANIPASANRALELPVVLRQSVIAGKTPVGTKIEAKLVVATLVSGKVVPKNAVLSGEVTLSEGKTASDPSRLSIRADSIRWKKDSVQINVYLTNWYYPLIAAAGEDSQDNPGQAADPAWNGAGQFPDARSPGYRPFPSADSGRASPVDTPNSVTPNHRVQMKNIECERKADGSVALVSPHNNIKLDKVTTYVLASSQLVPAK